MLVVTQNEGFAHIITQADPFVKFVMILLALASIATWAIWIGKTVQLAKAKRALTADVAKLWGMPAFDSIKDLRYYALQEMSQIAQDELRRAGGRPSDCEIEGVEERVGALLSICERGAVHNMLTGTNLLASVGATAPFIGLTGTVWGIMSSFLGIAASNSTSLAIVAPGLAEALFTTAIGLAAAIPAVLLYNNIARSIAGFRQSLGSAERLIMCAVSREARCHVGEGSVPLSPRERITPKTSVDLMLAAKGDPGSSAILGRR